MSFQITLGRNELLYIKELYGKLGGTILEYGSGGSTILALQENPSNNIISVETDSSWLCRLTSDIYDKGYQNRFYPVHVDIGATGLWGHPDFVKEGLTVPRMQKLLNYTTAPWKAIESKEQVPAVIMIDGRFRVACFVSACAFIGADTTIIIDDYQDRTYYSLVESIIRPSRVVGRMAIFEVSPGMLDARMLLGDFLRYYSDSR